MSPLDTIRAFAQVARYWDAEAKNARTPAYRLGCFRRSASARDAARLWIRWQREAAS